MDFSQGSLVEYVRWTRSVAPVLIALCYAWCMYKLIQSDKSGGIIMLVLAIIGGIIGGLIGLSINRKVINKTAAILEQIEELQRES